MPFLKEKLLEIKEACQNLDKKAAKNALAEIKSKAWSQPVKDQLSAIAGDLLHSDFEEIEKAIDEWLAV